MSLAIQPVSAVVPTPTQLYPATFNPKAAGVTNPFTQPEKTFTDSFIETAALRGVRDLAGQTLDNHFRFPKVCNPVFQAAAKRINAFSAQAQGYGSLFGIATGKFQVGSLAEAKELLGTTEGRQAIKEAIKGNFATLQTPETTLKAYATKTLLADNVATVTNPFSQGRLFTAAGKFLGAYWSVKSVAKTTIKAYDQSNSITHAARVLLKESTKSLVAWEVGSIGYLLGAALVPVAGFQVIASLAMMALGSAAVKKILN